MVADTAGQADLRNLNVDKLSKDMELENVIFKSLVKVTSTPAREIRWYQKTSGFLSVTTPATSKIAPGARPFVAEQSWTKNTSYTQKYFLESPMISLEDQSDSAVKLMVDNLSDIVAKVAFDEDSDIWDVVSESQSPSNINSVTSNAAWDAGSGQDPFEDIMEGIQLIREQTKRKIKNGVLLVSAKGEKDLLVWLVSTKGTSIPQFASQKIEDGILSSIAGLKVIVSENVTADYAMIADLTQAAEYKQFKPISSTKIEEPMVGTKIRVSANGKCLLVRPKFVTLISNTEL